MTLRHSSVFVVLVLALHSLSTTHARTKIPELPNQLKCEDGVCMSGHPEEAKAYLSIFNCRKSYTSCDILKRNEITNSWGLAFGERILIDLVALANVTSRQHEQVPKGLRS